MTKGRLRRWRVRAIFERALPSAIAYELKRAVNVPAGGSKGRAGVVVTDSWVMNNELGDGMLERFLDLVWRPAERRRRNAASLGARRRIEEHPGFAGVLLDTPTGP